MTMLESNELPALPDGWTTAPLVEVAEIILGQSPPSSTYNEDGRGLPFFQGKAEFGNLYPTPVKWCDTPKKIAEQGDILISVRAPVGTTNINPMKSCIGRGLAAIRPHADQDTFFFLHQLRHIEQELIDQATGTTFQSISGNILRNQRVKVAPLEEQRRIVEAIEVQFSRLDESTAVLHRLQQNIRRYRAALLKHACEGKLLPQDPTDEPADQLLQRILHERRQQWEAANAPAHPKNDAWKQKYVEPQGPDTADLPELPPNWVWVSLEQLIERIEAGKSPKTKNRPAESHEMGVLKVSAMSWGEFLPEENKALLDNHDFWDAPTVQKGDLLISRANTVELVGAVVFVKDAWPNLMLSDKSLRLVPVSLLIQKKYLLFSLRTSGVRKWFESEATGTSDSMRNLSQTKILATHIALAPLREQKRIVDEVERRLSLLDNLQQTITTSQKRAHRLRQAILHRAFSGQLVPPHNI